MEPAHQLLGTGKRHLVMGKVVEAVSALQESCAMLATKYGDTAEECGEAFFWCGKALLDLARMENSVLVNALEGVPEEEEEDKPKDSNVECTENIDEKTRDELRVQVYDAMAEKTVEDEEKVEGKQSKDEEKVEGKQSKDEEKVEGKRSKDEEMVEGKRSEDEEKVEGKRSKDEEKVEGKRSKDEEKVEGKQSKDEEMVEGKRSEDEEMVEGKRSEDEEMVEGKQSKDEEKVEGKRSKDEEKVEGKRSKDEEKVEGKRSEDEEMVEGKRSEDEEKSETAVEEQKTVKVEAKEEKNDQDDGSKPEEEEDTEETDEETSEKETESDEKEEEAADVEMASDAEAQGDQTAEKDSEEEEEEEDEDEEVDEEVGNLQLAWEMLEVAKVIYKRKDTKEDQLMAAQAHLKLGEVSAESGNYAQALEDFKECLKLQMNHLESDSRLLAETNYHLGLTYSLNFQYSQAIQALNSSIAVIKSRLDKLQEMLGKAEGPEALPDERREMEELNALLPEIQDKVEDATEGLKITNAAVDTLKEAVDKDISLLYGSTSRDDSSSIAANKDASCSSTSSTSEKASAAPVSDISHLVRKKRKPEDGPVEEESVVKKVKQDEGQPDAVKKP